MAAMSTNEPVHVVVSNFLEKKRKRSAPLAEIVEALGKKGLLKNANPVQVRASLLMRNKVEASNGRQPRFMISRNVVTLFQEESSENCQKAKILDALRQLRDLEKTLLEVLNAQQ